MSDEEREERYAEENTEKKPKTHTKLTPDYDDAATRYLDKLNKWIASQGHIPKFNSLDEYKEHTHLNPQKAYSRLMHVHDYFVKNISPKSGKPPELKSYAVVNVTYGDPSRVPSNVSSRVTSRISSPKLNQNLNNSFFHQ